MAEFGASALNGQQMSSITPRRWRTNEEFNDTDD